VNKKNSCERTVAVIIQSKTFTHRRPSNEKLPILQPTS